MARLTRRQLLHGAGLATAGVALAGCGSGSGEGGGNSKTLEWWDHFGPLKDLQKQTFADFEKDTGIHVEYTYHQAGKWAQALQLAQQSKQLPDIHSLANLGVPVAALADNDWFQPLDLDEEALGRVPEDSLVEGLHLFDGKLHSFPIFTFRQHRASHWFNTELVEQAGHDPAQPPTTYDEFRELARAVAGTRDGVYGLVANLGMPGRIGMQVHDLAQAAGFEGHLGVDFRTGEFAFHSEPYLTVLEFLLSLRKDKLLAPSSSGFNDKQGRARWATGLAASYFDGPWCAGVVVQDLGAFADKLGAGPILRPAAGSPGTVYRTPKGGTFWLSGQSKRQDEANQLLALLTTKEYLAGVASNMDQPPYDLNIVQDADVHPAYRTVIANFAEEVFLAPTPLGNNVAVTEVQAESEDISPGLGELIQGMFSGDVTDVRGALKQLSDKHAAGRERALAEAKKKGAKVSAEDFAFPNWKPGTDYTQDMYG